MKRKLQVLRQGYVLAAVLTFFTCASITLSGCFGGAGTKIDPSGPSHGDAVAFNYQLAINTQHAILQSFLDWERDNAPFLTNAPQIHDLAVKVRTEGPGWFTDADTKYQEYLAIRNAAQVDGSKLNKARAALLAALTIINTNKTQALVAMGSVALTPHE